MKSKVKYLVKSRIVKRENSRRNEDLQRTFVRLCKEFKDGFTWQVNQENIVIDEDKVFDLLNRLNHTWRKTCNHHNALEAPKGGVKPIYAFTSTCETFMEAVRDRIYTPYLIRLLETRYGVHADELDIGKLAGYRRAGLTANDAAIRVVLHCKSTINPLKKQ